MAQEIERKFLVTGDYRSSAISSSRIAQGYICSEQGRTVRIRIRDGRGYLTIKGPSTDNGLSRYEWEKEIPLEDARDLMKLCRGGVVDKTRYLVPFAGHTFEVDEFYGDRREVTGIRRYYNSQLMQRPYRSWSEDEKSQL